MKTFYLKVLAPDHPYYEGDCESLIITTMTGEYGILAGHSNLITAVSPGVLKFKTPNGDKYLAAVSKGILKVENNRVLILVNTIENPDEIDEKRALRDEEEAREALLQKKSMQDYRLAQAKMARAANRLKVKNSSQH